MTLFFLGWSLTTIGVALASGSGRLRGMPVTLIAAGCVLALGGILPEG